MNIFVKVPISKIGIQAGKILIERNIPVTFTACFEVKQILLASALGANYIAPYLNRISSKGKDGQAEIITMKRVLDGINSNCKLLVASIKNELEICNLASKGIDTFTINSYITQELFESGETDKAAMVFESDRSSNI